MTKKEIKKRIDPIKKPHQIESFTPEQIQELDKCSKDFIYFALNYVYIQHPTKGTVKFAPYDYQMDMLRGFIEFKHVTLLAARQCGKTSCAAIYILWRSIFRDDQTILIASNKNDSAIEVMDRIKFSYESLPQWLKPGSLVYNRKNVVFENGSEIITRATTKDTGRGLSISLLYCLSGLTTVKIKDKITLKERETNLVDLYKELKNNENDNYEILTPDGWKNFKGIQSKGKKLTARITLSEGYTVDSTYEHCFFNELGKVQLKDLKIGEKIKTINGFKEVIKIEELYIEEVFDIIEVEQKEHQFFVNSGIISKNCDEMAAIDPPSKQKDFWAAIRPTLSTGGDCIITSTPISDEDTFAQIWFAANDIFDAYGNENPKGIGKNGFKALKFTWDVHPERDEAWAEQERAAIGFDRFSREHNCLTGENIVKIQDVDGNIFDVTINELYKLMGENIND